MAKNALFLKSPVKNFHGRAKGGPSHRGPPPKYATDCVYPRRDGQAELTWVTGYIQIDGFPPCQRSSIQVGLLTDYGIGQLLNLRQMR